MTKFSKKSALRDFESNSFESKAKQSRDLVNYRSLYYSVVWMEMYIFKINTIGGLNCKMINIPYT